MNVHIFQTIFVLGMHRSLKLTARTTSGFFTLVCYNICIATLVGYYIYNFILILLSYFFLFFALSSIRVKKQCVKIGT